MTHQRSLVLALTVLSLSGCASWTTYNKSLDLTQRSVAIDAKQRVVYVNNSHDGYPIVCAEPSPDALAVLGASGALSVTEKSGAGGSASSSLAEAASSIGLRTQSIQLLRDLNYRICEAFNNQAIGRQEASALLRRGQSTMMGLIAIEQLTGPVVAAQATLGAAANGGTGGSNSDVTGAQTEFDEKTTQLLDIQAEQDTALTTHQNNQTAANTALTAYQNAIDASPADPTAIAAAKESRDMAVETAKTSGNALLDKQRRVAAAQQAVAQAKLALLKAKNLGTSTGGMASSSLGEIARANGVITDTIAKQVSSIVNQVNRSYLLDSCITLLTDQTNVATQSLTNSQYGQQRQQQTPRPNQAANNSYVDEGLREACVLLIGSAASDRDFFLKSP